MMVPGHHDRLLEHDPAGPPDDEALHGTDLLVVDTMRSGAAAPRHFGRQPDRKAFIARVPAGEALTD